MTHLITKLLEGAGIAIAAFLAGEAISKVATGKWLHENIYKIWEDLRPQIVKWLGDHQEFGAVRLIAKVVTKFDTVMCRWAPREVRVIAVNEQQQEALVSERTISMEEYRQIKNDLDYQEEMVLWEAA